jgi:acyl carrier protein
MAGQRGSPNDGAPQADSRRSDDLAVSDLVQEAWKHVLDQDGADPDDDFFALGGQSLLAVRMVARLRETLGVDLPLRALYETPTVAGLERHVVAARGSASLSCPPAIVATTDEQRLPLSFAQQRLWFLSQLMGAAQAYNIPMGFFLRGPLDALALERALDQLVARHEALRTTFPVEDGEPLQKIAPPSVGFMLQRHELERLPGAGQPLPTVIGQLVSAQFDLGAGPLIRGCLVRYARDEHVLVLTVHHLVADGWSLGIMRRELGALYDACARGEHNPLAPLEAQYRDYALWERRWLSPDRLTDERKYWDKALSEAPVLLDLPLDYPRPIQQDFSGAEVGLECDKILTGALKALSKRHGVTLFVTVLAAWALVLSRLSGQDDLVIGTPSANRTRSDIEEIVGLFANTLALRIDLSGDPSVAQLLQRIKAATLGALDHQALPFEQLVEQLRLPRSLAHTPVFQVMFGWRSDNGDELRLSGLQVEPVSIETKTAQVDLFLHLKETDGEIHGGITYASALFEMSSVQRYARYLCRALEQMAADESQSAGRLDILPPAEREQLLSAWNRASPHPITSN